MKKAKKNSAAVALGKLGYAKRVEIYGKKQLAEWGKLGGRPRKKKAKGSK